MTFEKSSEEGVCMCTRMCACVLILLKGEASVAAGKPVRGRVGSRNIERHQLCRTVVLKLFCTLKLPAELLKIPMFRPFSRLSEVAT